MAARTWRRPLALFLSATARLQVAAFVRGRSRGGMNANCLFSRNKKNAKHLAAENFGRKFAHARSRVSRAAAAGATARLCTDVTKLRARGRRDARILEKLVVRRRDLQRVNERPSADKNKNEKKKKTHTKRRRQTVWRGRWRRRFDGNAARVPVAQKCRRLAAATRSMLQLAVECA